MVGDRIAPRVSPSPPDSRSAGVQSRRPRACRVAGALRDKRDTRTAWRDRTPGDTSRREAPAGRTTRTSHPPGGKKKKGPAEKKINQSINFGKKKERNRIGEGSGDSPRTAGRFRFVGERGATRVPRALLEGGSLHVTVFIAVFSPLSFFFWSLRVIKFPCDLSRQICTIAASKTKKSFT